MKPNLKGVVLVVCASLLSVPAGAQETSSSPDLATASDMLEISDIFARATPPNAPTGAVYFSLVNLGEQPDRLIAGTTPMAQDVQFHSMMKQGDVMQMRQLVDGVEIAPGEMQTFSPGALHVMLIGLQQPLVEGDTFSLTLEFEHAGPVELDVPIAGIGARSAPGGANPLSSEGPVDHDRLQSRLNKSNRSRQ